MKLTPENIDNLYIKLKNKAANSLIKSNIDSSFIYLKCASITAYNFYLCFKDEKIEKLLSELSNFIIKQKLDDNLYENNCVFYDSFCLDNKGLTQQYIRAIMNLGWNLLYITDANKNNSRGTHIINEINRYSNSKIIYIPSNLGGIKRSQFIYDSVMQFNPSKIFMHLSPSAVYTISAFYALPKEIKKYQINITDHTFWIGQGCLDYSLEFRKLGVSLSIKERNINPNNIFILPYYPIITESKFQSFPYDFSNKTIVLSGGAYYKIIDDDNTFFKLMKIILEISTNVIILFAGAGDSSLFRNFIIKNNFQDRLFLIGYRKDINEVFKKSDIYLNTYPFIGGLMCQYAAINSMPILSYTSQGLSKAEEVVCQKRNIKISIDNLELFKKEASDLILNRKYREERGNELNNCMINEQEFNNLFQHTIINNKNQINFDKLDTENIFKDNNIEGKIEYEVKTNEFKLSIVSYLKFKTVLINLSLFFDIIIVVIKKRFIFKSIRRIIQSKS